MTDIKELIRKQAEAVKNKSNQILAAEHLEKAAALLRGEAAEPVKTAGFREVARARKARAGEIMASHYAAKEKEVETLLADAGWGKAFSNETSIRYGKKGKPGLVLTITGKEFTVKEGDTVIQAPTDLSMLKTYLDKSTKK